MSDKNWVMLSGLQNIFREARVPCVVKRDCYGPPYVFGNVALRLEPVLTAGDKMRQVNNQLHPSEPSRTHSGRSEQTGYEGILTAMVEQHTAHGAPEQDVPNSP
jgi:hypothetical protein